MNVHRETEVNVHRECCTSQSERERSQSSTEKTGDTESEACDNLYDVRVDPSLSFSRKVGYTCCSVDQRLGVLFLHTSCASPLVGR